MAIKLTITARHHIPDVMFKMDDGTVQANRDLPTEEQVRCEISVAPIGKKNEYLGSYTVANRKTVRTSGDVKQVTVFQYEICAKKRVGKISGLETYGIVDGKSLVAKQADFEEAKDLIEDCFFKINGIHPDDASYQTEEGDEDISFETSDSGEMSKGESPASE